MTNKTKVKQLEKRANQRLITKAPVKSILYDYRKALEEGRPTEGIALNTGNDLII